MNLSKFQWRPSHLLNNYELLPTGSRPGDTTRDHSRQKNRRCRFSLRAVVSTVAAVGVLWFLYGLSTRHRPPPYQPGVVTTDDGPEPPTDADIPQSPPQPPPLYEAYRERERNFPQHNLSLPYPDGLHAKYLWTANHGSNFGWGNYMEEMILDSYLAYAAQRAYVFDNYTWDRYGPEISSWNGKPIPARIPLSALISGPIIGGVMRDKDVPRAVSREFFFSVCPESERVVLDTRKIQDTLPADATVSQIVTRWVTELHSIKSPCVELARDSPPLFGYELTNTKRVLDVFPALSQSPILSDFGWSPLILEGFYANLPFFTSGSGSDSDNPPLLTETPNTPLRGLLALHVRRGDFESWCDNTFTWTMAFTGFNSFPALPDQYAPSRADPVEVSRAHCLPSIPEIVEKVRKVTAGAPHITRVYVMTNAPRPWLAQLKAALGAAHDWADGIATSRDLKLSWEQKFVAEAVDMYVGQRAEKFIGNGFSSLTTNVVMLRMHNPDIHPADTRFW